MKNTYIRRILGSIEGEVKTKMSCSMGSLWKTASLLVFVKLSSLHTFKVEHWSALDLCFIIQILSPSSVKSVSFVFDCVPVLLSPVRVPCSPNAGFPTYICAATLGHALPGQVENPRPN